METTLEAPLAETKTAKRPPLLEIAWQRFSQLNESSIRRTAAHRRLRITIATLGVLATLFSVIYGNYFAPFEDNPAEGPAVVVAGNVLIPPGVFSLAIKIFFVIIPIVASLLAAFGSRTFANGDWLVTRAAAEEYLKEIYLYRTVLQKDPRRREYLEKRVNEIQRQLYQGLGGELVFRPYKGPIPPYYNPDWGNDPGFHDLTGEEYFKFRLDDQLQWHVKEVNELRRERALLTFLVLLAGGLGAAFAAFGGPLSLWVALIASISAALAGWQQLRNVDAVIKNYSKVILELTMVYDHWRNLEPEERTDAEFYKMVRGCEDVLWAQNTEYIKTMQKALDDSSLEKEADMVDRIIKESVESDARTKQMRRDALVEAATESLETAEARMEEDFTNAVGSLAEEASSELVQQELAAMGEAVHEAIGDVAERIRDHISAFQSALADIADDFKHVEVTKETSKEELNAILARYPTTDEVKG